MFVAVAVDVSAGGGGGGGGDGGDSGLTAARATCGLSEVIAGSSTAPPSTPALITCWRVSRGPRPSSPVTSFACSSCRNASQITSSPSETPRRCSTRRRNSGTDTAPSHACHTAATVRLRAWARCSTVS